MNTRHSQEQVATRLIAAVSARADSPADPLEIALKTCDMLRMPITRLAGAAGFASLLSRAVALAKRRTRALEGLQVDEDGTFSRLPLLVNPDAPAGNFPPVGVILVAEMLGLLVSFIGETLTIRLIRGALPIPPGEFLSVTPEEKS